MKILLLFLFTFLLSLSAEAKTLYQKKNELKKIYEAGGLSKIEYEKASKFLEKSEDQEKKAKKQSFSMKKKKKAKKSIDSILKEFNPLP